MIATAALTVTSTAAEQVFVSVNSAPFAPLSPEGLLLEGIPDRLVDYRVAAYTVDRAGNISALREVQYRIDRRDAVSGIAQPIISPVAGSFANRQRFLVAPGIRVVRATLEPGSQELEPNQVVSGDGTFQLSGRVALPDGSERDFRVEWRQQDLAVTNLPRAGSTVMRLPWLHRHPGCDSAWTTVRCDRTLRCSCNRSPSDRAPIRSAP